jgi:hypothetical protein
MIRMKRGKDLKMESRTRVARKDNKNVWFEQRKQREQSLGFGLIGLGSL